MSRSGRRDLTTIIAVAITIAAALAMVAITEVQSARRVKPPKPTPVVTPVAWSEEFTSGMGAFTGIDHDYGVTHVTPIQCVVTGGNLELQARYIGEGQFDSCMARTALTFDHGYFETRMQFPYGDYDAAFWLRRPDTYASPRDEIDIVEAYPTDYSGCPGPTKYQATMHYVSGGSLLYRQVTHDAGHSLVGEWHTYGAEWLSGNRLTFYMDGVALPEAGNPITSNVIAASPFNIVFSLAVGSWCEPEPNVPTETPTLGVMRADYARWYEAKP